MRSITLPCSSDVCVLYIYTNTHLFGYFTLKERQVKYVRTNIEENKKHIFLQFISNSIETLPRKLVKPHEHNFYRMHAHNGSTRNEK